MNAKRDYGVGPAASEDRFGDGGVLALSADRCRHEAVDERKQREGHDQFEKG
jgi:hypothetical protein